MLYARVVLGIPVEGPFDYSVPVNLTKKVKVGMRVRINFRSKEAVGYVVKLSAKTKIKYIKPILEIIDDSPILDRNILLLTKRVCDYYCCYLGEVIETALPDGLRKGQPLSKIPVDKLLATINNQPESSIKDNTLLIHDIEGKARWDIYLRNITEALNINKSVIILYPNINSALKAKERIADDLGISSIVLYRKQPKELEQWVRIKQMKAGIVIGTRSAIFAPLNDLGLIIIDEEQDSAYKQDQQPHYHAREVAFMRSDIDKAKLILASSAPSLESFYLAKRKAVKYKFIPKVFPEIKIINTGSEPYSSKQRSVLSRYFQDLIITSLNAKGKILLFLNRRGFATFAYCRYCSQVLKCPRCNINLVYHFKDGILNCHYCNFKMQPTNICPNCNSGYIRYSGLGTEKMESEISRLFPQIRIKRLDKNIKAVDINDADIFITTKSILGQTGYNFFLVGILSIDNSLNRVDFRSTEKTFGLLMGLLGLTKDKFVIQTGLSKHHCFEALANKDVNLFYDCELSQRKQLNFPPFSHLGIVKLRGRKELKVREISEDLFGRFNKLNKNRVIKIVSVNPAQPAKLRDNFYWQILIKSNKAEEISKFLKKYLKDFSHSGIIVTVDIDPL